MRWLADRPIRLRLTVTYAALFLAAGTVLLTVAYGLVAHSLSSGANASATSNASSAATTSNPPASSPSEAQQDSDANAVAKLKAYCEQLHDSGRLEKQTLQDCENTFKAGAAAGTSDQSSRTLNSLLTYSVISLGALTGLSGLLGWIIAGRALRPVTVITDAARRASDRHLGERLAMAGPKDEIRRLAEAFDEMLDRLDRSFTGQRRFVANASHELRTPLAVIRTAVDVTMAKPTRTPAQLESMAGEVRDGVRRAEATVAALLALARSDQPVTAAEPTDLATAVEDAVDLASARIRAAGLSIETTLDPAPVSGDAVLLERMAANIVDNAIVHNVRSGSVRVRTGQVGGRAFLEAENTGAVIPDDLVPGLFEPFRRLDERTRSDSGVGIGLSIVAAVAAAHHGDVSARARAGGGLTVRIELPTTDGGGSGPKTEGSDRH